MSKITLYHGTSSESATSIIKSGSINGRVYLSPSIDVAADYAGNNDSDYTVFEVEVDYSALKPDSEFISGDTDDLKDHGLVTGFFASVADS